MKEKIINYDITKKNGEYLLWKNTEVKKDGELKTTDFKRVFKGTKKECEQRKKELENEQRRVRKAEKRRSDKTSARAK